MAAGQEYGYPSVTTGPPGVRAEGGGQVGMATVDDLLMRVARGEPKAFAGVCDHVSGAVYGLVSRIVEDQSRAERVATDVLVEVWRSAPQFRPAEGSGLSWVMTMARRMAVSHAGIAVNHRNAGLMPPGTVGMIAERTARNLLAHRGLASLPGPQREAMLLACCGYTCPQIADLVGVSAETVAERLRAGLLGLTSGPDESETADRHPGGGLATLARRAGRVVNNRAGELRIGGPQHTWRRRGFAVPRRCYSLVRRSVKTISTMAGTVS